MYCCTYVLLYILDVVIQQHDGICRGHVKIFEISSVTKQSYCSTIIGFFFCFSYLASDFLSSTPIQPHTYERIIMQSAPPTYMLEWSRNAQWCSMELVYTLSWSDVEGETPFSLTWSPASHHSVIRRFVRQRIRTVLGFIPEFEGSGK
jgi:hypothetical protein